jgi:FkbM family methyltransferase
MSVLDRSRDVVREEGFLVFLLRALGYVRKRVCRSLERVTYLLLWRVEYGLSVELGTRPAGHSERRVIDDLFRNLRDDDVFYDVGAYHGLHAVPVGALLPPNRAVAFEPGGSVSGVRSNLREHGIEAHVVEKAIGQRESDTQYYQDEWKGELIGTLTDSDGAESSPDVITGEELAASDVPLPTVLKIDVRGAELDVLRGLEGVLRRPECRLVYLETHMPMGDKWTNVEEHRANWSFDEILDLFRRCGFECELMFVRGQYNLFVKADKPS